ncbi:MAG TPA: iron-containing alcohol dehydrogenase [Tepidisphaeraceae bacterium]|jgi:alcohol dehydrogenase class IV
MTFDFFNLPRIHFGPGELGRLSELFSRLGHRPLLIFNGSPDRIAPLLPHAIPLHQRGEPTVVDIDSAVVLARRESCDCIIALGGGSAMDAAKAVAGIVTNGGAATDYMEVVGSGQTLTRPALPWIAIPTTAGTGAEVTRNAVVGWPEKKFKASIRSEHLLPRAVIVDPQLHVDVPPDVTARSGMDALCQCIEAYTSKNAQPITDALALRGAALAAQSLHRAYADGNDLPARENMALAALFSGIALTNAGLGAVHGFAAPIGANFPIPHGTVCGVLLPHVIRANLASAADSLRDRYITLGRAITGSTALSEGATAEACATIAEQLVQNLHLPRLREFGVAEAHLDDMVGLAKRSSSMKYNAVQLSDESLRQVLLNAL